MSIIMNIGVGYIFIREILGNKAVYTSQSLQKGLILLEFTWIYLNFLEFAVWKKTPYRPTDQQMDGQTDRPTDRRMDKASYRDV